MKRNLLILLAFISMVPLFAQRGFTFGLNTGVYNTWLLDPGISTSAQREYELTFNLAPVGLALGYDFNESTGLLLEANLMNMGQEYTITYQDFDDTDVNTTELTYLSVPLLLKAMGGADNTVRFHFYIGPQFSFLQSGKETYTLDGDDYTFASTESGDFDENVPDSLQYGFQTFDISGIIGFGVDIYVLENFYISTDLRFGYGFFDIRGDDYEDFVKSDPDIYYDSDEVSGYQPRNNIFGGFQLGFHYKIFH